MGRHARTTTSPTLATGGSAGPAKEATSPVSPWLFTGGRHSGSTGLHRNRARALGRLRRVGDGIISPVRFQGFPSPQARPQQMALRRRFTTPKRALQRIFDADGDPQEATHVSAKGRPYDKFRSTGRLLLGSHTSSGPGHVRSGDTGATLSPRVLTYGVERLPVRLLTCSRGVGEIHALNGCNIPSSALTDTPSTSLAPN